MAENISIKQKEHSRWQSECGRYTVTIYVDCFKSMLELAHKYYPKEIGSSLIGWYSKDGFDAYVSNLTPIPSDSVSMLNRFYRGIKGLRKFYKNLNKSHSGIIHYVGEWHSHPNGISFPSSIDDANQMAISNDKKTSCPESVLIIISGDFSLKYKLGIFIYSRKSGRIQLRQSI